MIAARILTIATLLIFWMLAPFTLASTPQLFTTHYDLTKAYGTDISYMLTQDNNGVIFVANHDGIFEYSGNKWVYINDTYNIDPGPITHDATTNRILVAGSNDIGYIEKDNNGVSTFFSIKHLFDDKAFSHISNIKVNNEAVYFKKHDQIFVWNKKNNINRIENTENSLGLKIFLNQNKFIVYINNKGLYTVNQFKLVPFFLDPFFKDHYIQFIAPWENDTIILGTVDNGLFILLNNKIQPFKTEIDKLFKESRISDGIRLSNGNLAIAFLNLTDTIAIINKTGKLLFHINDERLEKAEIGQLYEDQNHNLWVVSDHGVAKIELTSPTFFDIRTGIYGAIYDLMKQGNYIFLATSYGLFKLNTQLENQGFTRITSTTSNCVDLTMTALGILAACHNEILLISQDNTKIIIPGDPSSNHKHMSTIKPISDEETSFLVSHGHGLSTLTLKGNKWQLSELKAFNHVPFELTQFTRENPHTYWFPNWRNGITKVAFKDNFQSADISHYNHKTHPSLPIGYTEAHMIDDQLIFITERGFYQLNKNVQPEVFHPSNIFNKKFAELPVSAKMLNDDIIEVRQFAPVINRDTSVNRLTNLFIGKKDTFGKYHWSNNEAFARIHLKNNFRSLYDSPGIVWVQSDDTLYKVHYTSPVLNDNLKPPLINSVYTLKTKNKLPIIQDLHDNTELDFTNNSIRFDYSLTYFIDEDYTQYQTRLMGFDDDWSTWSTQGSKEYSNLFEGKYTFHVRAKNIYENISPTRSYTFTVVPPWHRSWQAYLSYLLIFVTLSILTIKLYTRNIRKKAEYLEEKVTERTQQVSTLLEQKNNMFANISHELRTPLTLMMGPVELLLKGDKTLDKPYYLNLIKQNGSRLIRLVEQMLSITKVSSKLEIPYKQQTIQPLVNFIVDSFQPIAVKKQIQLSCRPYKNVLISMQEDALEKILLNLISNAIKYTPADGTIELTIDIESDNRTLLIQVRDSGHGIPENQKEAIFEKFNRLDIPGHINPHGTGIGLALVKDLVEAHDGKIKVSNAGGQGSLFSVSLPVILSTEPAASDSDSSYFNLANLTLELNVLAHQTDTNKTALEHTKSTQSDFDYNKISILIIEDTADMRTFLVDIFSKNYNCLSAKNGDEGVKLAKVHIPDLIITDLMMPGKSGFEVCHELKHDMMTCHIPIIILTAKGDFESRMQGWTEKADEYLAKPFSADELELRVRNLIGIREMLKQRFSREFHLSNADPLEKFIQELNERDQQFLEKFNIVINDNHHDPTFNIEIAAKNLAMSDRKLQRKLKALIDHSFRGYLRTYRLKEARKHLINGKNISDTVHLTGFGSASYFTKCFKAEYGYSPSHHSMNTTC